MTRLRERSKLTDAQVRRLQDVLDHVTENPKLWNQNAWCHLNGQRAEQLTSEHVEAGVYHGFKLSKTTRAALTGLDTYFQPVPVEPCGTSFCLAGHVAIRNGYTFVTTPREDDAWRVVRTSRLQMFLSNTGPRSFFERESVMASEAAQELLGLTREAANHMFWGSNRLVDLWALGYAVSDARLRLPDALPDVGDSPDVVARSVIAALQSICLRSLNTGGSLFARIERAVVTLSRQLGADGDG